MESYRWLSPLGQVMDKEVKQIGWLMENHRFLFSFSCAECSNRNIQEKAWEKNRKVSA
jgi:hypothetical protein